MNSVASIRRLAVLLPHRRLWCALLVVATWRGPMPIVHAHRIGERDGVSNASLAQHLWQYHLRDNSHEYSGWHVHLALPWQECGDEGAGDPCEPHDPLLGSVVKCGQQAAEKVQHLLGGEAYRCSAWPSPARLPRTLHGDQLDPFPCSGFHSSLSARMAATSLRAVTGVALC